MYTLRTQPTFNLNINANVNIVLDRPVLKASEKSPQDFGIPLHRVKSPTLYTLGNCIYTQCNTLRKLPHVFCVIFLESYIM